MTLTETSVTIAWMTYEHAHMPYFIEQEPLPADTELLLRPLDSPARALQTVFYDPIPRGYHQATVRGLEPGRSYAFEARSNGAKAVPNYITTSFVDPMIKHGIFTTLAPPPGQFVQTVAVLNDTHVGLGAHLLKGSGGIPYANEILADALTEIARVSPSIVVVNGDITAEARLNELRDAKALLDAYGAEKRDYVLTRGNHDRPRKASEDPNTNYGAATPLPRALYADPEATPSLSSSSVSSAHGGEPYYDTVSDVFDLPYQQMWATRRGNLRLIGLDSSEAGNHGGGTLYRAQLDAFEAEVSSAPDAPTICFSHHPLTSEQALTAFGSRPFLMDKRSATRVEEIMASSPGSFLHLSGHTHRGRRSRGSIAVDTDFIETPATGEFPTCYTLLNLYTGGYTVTSHRPDTERVRDRMVPERWSQYGVIPEGTVYRTDHRNFTVVRDLSALG